MPNRIFIVDAFTAEPFKGNQAGVCLLSSNSDTIDDKILQNIAFEMKLSETAFISTFNGNNDFKNSAEFNLRWFTPTTEMDLCGHATLASAHVLFKEIKNITSELHFHTRSGILKVSGNEHNLTMDLPINKSRKISPISSIGKNLGLKANEIIHWEYDSNLANVLVEVPDVETLTKIEPDFSKLVSEKYDLKIAGVIVTTKMHDSKYDFASRYFAPWVDINEDSVTGASHTTLAPYWSQKLNKKILNAVQLSKRTGEMRITVSESRVFITGIACTFLQGSIKV